MNKKENKDSEIISIFVNFIINLSRGVDNCLGHYASTRIASSAHGRFIADTFEEDFIEELKNADIIKKFYEVAYKRVKDVNVNTVPYNLCIVLFVSSLEMLFHSIFSYIINNDKSVKEKFIESDKKVSLKFLEDYKKGKIKFADVIIEAKGYNFQNLDSTREAFLWLKNTDLYKIINGIKTNSGINNVKRLNNIIEIRHKIIHEAYNDNSLTFKEITKIHAFVFHIGLSIFMTLLQDELLKDESKKLITS